MGVDPVIVQKVASNVRAEVLPRAQAYKFDPAIVEKIAQKVPIFSGMTMACLMDTLAVAENFTVQAGELVFAEGDIGNSFYVLIKGEVVVEKSSAGKAAPLVRLGPGECFGEMALVGNEVRTATVRALDEVIAIRFYRELIDSNPESAHIIYRNIARILAARLGQSSIQLADLVVQTRAAGT